MNRLILKYGYPITAVILLIFAWVIIQRALGGWANVATLVIAAAILLAIGVPTFIATWPRITVNGFKRVILTRGFGNGPIPINTMYAVSDTSSESAAAGSLIATGTDDVLYVGGWLDVRDRPQVLHVPEMAGRYYSVQFTDPATSANFAYVGKRTTGTAESDFLLTGPSWKGTVPAGMTPIACPGGSALLIGRVFVADDADRSTAFALAQQIGLSPLTS